MVKIGRRLARSNTMLERIVGFSLAKQGAALGKDPRGAARAVREWKTAVDAYHRAHGQSRKAGIWPFSAMCADWTPDEVGYFGKFAE